MNCSAEPAIWHELTIRWAEVTLHSYDSVEAFLKRTALAKGPNFGSVS